MDDNNILSKMKLLNERRVKLSDEEVNNKTEEFKRLVRERKDKNITFYIYGKELVIPKNLLLRWEILMRMKLDENELEYICTEAYGKNIPDDLNNSEDGIPYILETDIEGIVGLLKIL